MVKPVTHSNVAQESALPRSTRGGQDMRSEGAFNSHYHGNLPPPPL